VVAAYSQGVCRCGKVDRSRDRRRSCGSVQIRCALWSGGKTVDEENPAIKRCLQVHGWWQAINTTCLAILGDTQSAPEYLNRRVVAPFSSRLSRRADRRGRRQATAPIAE
jgi:hypothetical protein